jgi:uncharacterized protein (DUF2235 family)
MSKNIVVCCDGTGNEFGESNSNVVDLYKTLICDQRQVAYYHPGVGTLGSRSALSRIGKWWTKVIGLAFGYGLSDNVADAYQFLMRNFESEDKVYVFGFSRGAYTARALCGMLHAIGLLTRGNEGLIPYAIRMIKKKKIDFSVLADFKKTFARPACRECKGWCAHDCRPYFVGVWDTVSSVGWVYNAVTFQYTRATKNPDFHIMRHAVSIDERRAFFPSNTFGDPNNNDQDLMEVLFAGVHSDVGGSYPEKESQLSKIALRWMLREAERAGLVISAQRKSDLLGGKPPYVAPDPTTKNQHKSLRRWWWIAEVWPKMVPVLKNGEWKKRIRINLGRRRRFAPNPLVHESVVQRLKGTNFPYDPPNLPMPYRVIADGQGQEVRAAVQQSA